MNKSFFVMAISAMFFISCSNKETNVIAVDEPQAPEVVALKNDLKALNNELFGEQVVTKARPKWWQVLLTAIADAGVGLLTGNVGYAISASSLTWTVVKDLSVQKIETKSDDETFCSVRDSVFAMSHLDIDGNDNNDGVLHNQVILKLYERYGEELFKMPEEVLLQAVADEVALLTGCEANEVIPNVAEAKVEMKVYTDAYIESANVDEYIGRLKAVMKKESLAVTVCDKNIYEITSISIAKLHAFIGDMQLTKQQELIGKRILKEIRARVGFLMEVGLEYLSLSRATGSLSGGESQRIRLATQIGSGLVGVCYILDEPSIGLHQRDNDKLIAALKNLRDMGNTLLVVEHDEDTMLAADHIVDIGPGAGSRGGEVVAQGTAEEIMQVEESVTGQYLSGKLQIPVPKTRRKPRGWLTVKGAEENNLKKIDVNNFQFIDLRQIGNPVIAYMVGNPVGQKRVRME